ncbi:B3 domain-containing protein REM10-like [Solanum dulcamara]|uniref:B3 domain-containing protein REM10-like n=1 Tax=Solanum dulcamara TaxID=45834 RepID=UPI0024852182|nr:B3 domain-containing protein REM10-like [Solanum dulcamara]
MKISPKKPHFFKPILPGFKQGIKIPKGFLKYLMRHDQYEHAILTRAATADKMWRVKVNGRRLEGGWEKFAEQHDLQLRDILVFRHEGDMEFEVSIFDLNQQCEREYEEEGGGGEATIAHEPLGCSHFECIIKPYCLKYDYLCLPKHFVLANNLTNKKCDLIIRDERQKSWNLKLASYDSHRVNIGNGWHEFRVVNDLKEGDRVMFEIVTNGKKLIWQFHNKPNHNIKSSRKSSPLAEVVTHKPIAHSHFVCIVRPYCLSRDSLLIPKEFASANGLFNIKKRDLLVRDERQRSWNVILRLYNNNYVYLKNGWNKIRDANCLKEGDRIMFEVVTDRKKPIWKFYGKISEEND